MASHPMDRRRGNPQPNARMPREVMARLERVAEVMAQRNPGLRIGRTDAIRAAVAIGLPVLEEQYGITNAPARRTRRTAAAG